MNRQEIFDIWAPPDSLWARWAKPVLFAYMQPPDMDRRILDWKFLKLAWAPSVDDRTAVILDLDEGNALSLGMALAARGFRPVPLYNGCPGMDAVVPMESIMRGLREYTDDLAQMNIHRDAPPVFLLDSGRMPTRNKPAPGRFDNRWMVYPQDLPSAHFLLSRQIDQVLIVSDKSVQPARDLAHVLLRWQQAGITILGKSFAKDMKPEPIRVQQPPHYRMWWYRLMESLGLHRNSAGGFGAMVPFPSQGGGWSVG